MARRAARRDRGTSFSLADLLTVLRVAQHCSEPAAVDASWRILTSLFPLEAMADAFEANQAAPDGAGPKKH